MGISNLLPFLRQHAPATLRPFAQPWPEGSTVAVDVPIFAHKFIYKERTYDALETRFIRFAHELLANGATPIFVFDGKKLSLKDNERKKRAVARDKQMARVELQQSRVEASLLESTSIEIVMPPELAVGSPSEVFQGILFPTYREYKSLLARLKNEGFQVAEAKYEAEALCAYLTQMGKAYAVLTEDTDALAFGSVRTVFRFLTEQPIVVEISDVLTHLELSPVQFRQLCCMLGCDFCENVYMIGPVKAFHLLRKYGSWPTIYETEAPSWPPKTSLSADKFDTTFQKVMELFTSAGYEAHDEESGSK